MSGPKSFHYVVDEQALRAQREATRLAAEAARLLAVRKLLRREWAAAAEQYGASVGTAPDLAVPGLDAESQAAFERRLSDARALLSERVRRGAQAAMLAAIAGAIAGGESVDATLDGEAARGGDAAPEALAGAIGGGESVDATLDGEAAIGGEARDGEAALERAIARVHGDPAAGSEHAAQLAAAVARNVARLPVGVTDAERARVASIAESVLLRANEPYAEERLDGLRAAVIDVERDVAAREERERAVAAALARLAALGVPAEAEVVALVEGARGGSGPLPAAIETRVREVEAIAARREERAYVSDVLERSLAELGYEVGPGFETTLDADGFADVAVPAWPGYDVRVRSAPAGGRLTFNVVRGEGDVDPRRDAEVEQEWCDALPELVDGLARAGVDVERVAAVPAGAQPVQVDPSLPAISGRAGAQRLRERPVQGR